MYTYNVCLNRRVEETSEYETHNKEPYSPCHARCVAYNMLAF